jgi:hypothetical protein
VTYHEKEVIPMTKREYFAVIRNIVSDNADLVAFVDHEVELLDKKNSAPKKPTAKQLDNENYKVAILEYLAKATEPATVGEIQKEVFGEDLTNQRVSALITALKNDGKIVRSVVGRKAVFSLA